LGKSGGYDWKKGGGKDQGQKNSDTATGLKKMGMWLGNGLRRRHLGHSRKKGVTRLPGSMFGKEETEEGYLKDRERFFGIRKRGERGMNL